MRQLFIIVLCTSLAGSGFGQDSIYNFKSDGRSVTWETTFHNEKDVKQLISAMKLSNGVRNIDTVDGRIIAELKDLSADYKGAGIRKDEMNPFIQRSFMNGFVTIELLSTGKLAKVSIKKIEYVLSEDVPLMNWHRGDKLTYNDDAITNKGKFRTKSLLAWNQNYKVTHYTLNRLFSDIFTVH